MFETGTSEVQLPPVPENYLRHHVIPRIPCENYPSKQKERGGQDRETF